MVDIMQLLEGAAYIGFVAGALFAVVELRDMKKDRRTQLVFEIYNKFSESDFMGHVTNILYNKFEGGKEAEQKCSVVSLMAVGNYMDGIGVLVEKNLVDRHIVFETTPIEILWDKMKPWVLYQREKLQAPILHHFERTAAEQTQYKPMSIK